VIIDLSDRMFRLLPVRRRPQPLKSSVEYPSNSTLWWVSGAGCRHSRFADASERTTVPVSLLFCSTGSRHHQLRERWAYWWLLLAPGGPQPSTVGWWLAGFRPI